MNILVTGMSGFVGQEVKRGFKAAGHAVKGVPRQVLMDGGEQLDELLEDADVVINLAGASLMGRWTEEYKKKILISRQIGTQNLVDAMNRVKRNKEPEIGVKLFISASAVGIYRTGALSDENTQEIESGFLPEVVKTWESEATQALGVRTVILRFGVIVFGTFPAGRGGGKRKTAFPFDSYRRCRGIYALCFKTRRCGGCLQYGDPGRDDLPGIYKSFVENSPSVADFFPAGGSVEAGYGEFRDDPYPHASRGSRAVAGFGLSVEI